MSEANNSVEEKREKSIASLPCPHSAQLMPRAIDGGKNFCWWCKNIWLMLIIIGWNGYSVYLIILSF